ncbi:MAG: hypothetical protein ABJ239_04690 [Erythrobacter sp.]
MSRIGEQLEAQVSRMARRTNGADRLSNLRYDREFAALIKLLRPRIAYLIDQYSLTDMREDAEQVCAIAIHRALESYDRKRALFTTHVTWALRGELQSLRHRVRLDQRKSARTAGIRTVSLESMMAPDADGSSAASTFEIVDERAHDAIQSNVSNVLARRSLARLMDRIGSLECEQQVVWDALADATPSRPKGSPQTQRFSSEQRRQIVRRTYRNCAKVLAG